MNGVSRRLPHSIEAETAVIGGILLRNDALRAIPQLTAEHFFSPPHSTVFSAILELAESRKAIDEVTIGDWLRDRGRLEAVGGLAFLSRCAIRVPTADSVREYASRIQGYAAVRELMMTSATILERGYHHTDAELYLSESLESLSRVARQSSDGPLDAPTLSRALIEDLEQRRNGIKPPSLSTGISSLDAILMGLRPGELTVAAGRPGMGKSNLLLSAARANAKNLVPTLMFSLEMSAAHLFERVLCAEASIDTLSLRRGTFGDGVFRGAMRGVSQMGNWPLYIEDTSRIPLAKARAMALQFVAESKADLGLLLVDYLQLLGPDRLGVRREEHIEECAYSLKGLSRDTGWPVLVAAQLNRLTETRHDKRPMLSDLRSSGAIEQAADHVVLLYRDEYYNPESAAPGTAEISVAKNRHGETGTVTVGFEGRFARFVDL